MLLALYFSHADNPWDSNTFRSRKYFVTNLCLLAVQDAMKAGDYGKSLKYLFQPDTKEDNKAGRHDTKSNVQGLLITIPPDIIKFTMASTRRPGL